MNDSWGCYAKGNESVAERQTLCGSIYMKYPERLAEVGEKGKTS